MGCILTVLASAMLRVASIFAVVYLSVTYIPSSISVMAPDLVNSYVGAMNNLVIAIGADEASKQMLTVSQWGYILFGTGSVFIYQILVVMIIVMLIVTPRSKQSSIRSSYCAKENAKKNTASKGMP